MTDKKSWILRITFKYPDLTVLGTLRLFWRMFPRGEREMHWAGFSSSPLEQSLNPSQTALNSIHSPVMLDGVNPRRKLSVLIGQILEIGFWLVILVTTSYWLVRFVSTGFWLVSYLRHISSFVQGSHKMQVFHQRGLDSPPRCHRAWSGWSVISSPDTWCRWRAHQTCLRTLTHCCTTSRDPNTGCCHTSSCPEDSDTLQSLTPVSDTWVS